MAIDSGVIVGAAAYAAGRRNEILRRLTDLFIVRAPQLTEDQIALFDDIIFQLAAQIENSARALLAIRLAPIPNAPRKVIRSLAFDDALDVASPVLSQSERLNDDDLIENAKLKGQGHMLAISRRRQLSEAVTDLLVDLGDQQVALNTVKNAGAKFSNFGFSTLVSRSENDETLALCVGGRPEIPPALLRKLIQRASQSVRTKLEAIHPEALRVVREVVDEVSARIETQMLSNFVDYTDAMATIEVAQREGRLGDAYLLQLAEAGHLLELTAALAMMCNISIPLIEQALNERQPEMLLMMARTLNLRSMTLRAILRRRKHNRGSAEADTQRCLASYERLSFKTATKILDFYRWRDAGHNAVS